jgi:hypothetical protein
VNLSDPTGLWIEDALTDKTFTPDAAQAFVESWVAPRIRQIAFETELGNRVVDAYGVLNQWMNEVKTGGVVALDPGEHIAQLSHLEGQAWT